MNERMAEEEKKQKLYYIIGQVTTTFNMYSIYNFSLAGWRGFPLPWHEESGGGRLGRAHTRKLVSSVEKSCGKFRIFHFCVSSNVRESKSKSSECQSVYVKEKVMRKIHELTFYSPSLSFIPCRNHLCDVHTLCDRWLAWFLCSISQRCCCVLCEHESCRFFARRKRER